MKLQHRHSIEVNVFIRNAQLENLVVTSHHQVEKSVEVCAYSATMKSLNVQCNYFEIHRKPSEAVSCKNSIFSTSRQFHSTLRTSLRGILR